MQEKKKYTWDAFKEIFIKGALPLPEEQMQSMYNSTANWQDFFRPLKEEIEIGAFCNFIPYMFVLAGLRPVTYETAAQLY